MQWFLLIGFVAGMRTMTPITVLCWFAWLNLLPETGWAAWTGSIFSVIGFTISALGEYVVDVLPQTPSRLEPPLLLARVVSGAVACVLTMHVFEQPIIGGVLFGGVGALLGAYGGYQARTWLAGKVGRDLPAGIGESAVALGLVVFAMVRLQLEFHRELTHSPW